MQAGTRAEIDDIGFLSPDMVKTETLEAGEVGYIITGIKDVAKLRVGDTLTTEAGPATEPLPGYQEARPVVFCGLYPIDTDRTRTCATRSRSWRSTTPSLSYEPETSQALGFGFRCGFLGLLHMDIVRERLEREYGLELLATTPNVEYHVRMRERRDARGPQPDRHARPELHRGGRGALHPRDASSRRPTSSGRSWSCARTRRGTHIDMHYLSEQRVQMRYDLPLAEIVLDFYDQLKSRSRGYASLDYEIIGYRESDLVKLDIMLAGDPSTRSRWSSTRTRPTTRARRWSSACRRRSRASSTRSRSRPRSARASSPARPSSRCART